MFNTVGKSMLVAAGGVKLASAAAPITLESLNIEKGSVTVSGLSSGGYMAVQMHVAFSEMFNGVGVFAGGPYFCALGNLIVAEEECMYALMGGPKVDDLIAYTDSQAKLGTIDATSNMANDKVYVFSGTKDTTIAPSVVKTLEDYYAPYVTSSVVTEYTLAAQHCIPTLDYGEQCDIKKSPYIGDCDYDGAGHALQTMYGEDLSIGTSKDANLFQFDQTEFFTGSSTSINDFGYIYIPDACQDGSTACRLHVSYHGCVQDYDSIGDTWAVHAGYNDWAENNNIVVVYPYVTADLKMGNGNACWDWWGYTGADYVLQSGVQMTFSKKVVDRIVGDSFGDDDTVSTDDTPVADDGTDDSVSTDDHTTTDDISQEDDHSSGPVTLKAYNISSTDVTVSGLSSGGYMAVQMHVAFSEMFNGVGVFAGGPYFCALGNLIVAEEECMYAMMGGPKVDDLIAYTNEQALKGTIDATSNMANDKVYVFSGTKDTTVAPSVVKTLEDYYAPYVTSSLVTEYTIAAQHCIPTLDYGEQCDIKKSPYIGDCDYDGAGHAFQTMYGEGLTVGTAIEGNLFQFDQTEFFTGSSTSINDFGYIYVPNACQDGSTACRLHVSYHGCVQDYDSIGDTWAVHAGYNDWAENNNIVVVYPYVTADLKMGNGNACWDWWGYTGADYVLQSGVQMTFSKKVVDRIMGN